MAASRPLRLRPHDVAVALQLVGSPEASYPALAKATGFSLGEAHNAVQRLEAARLVLPGRRVVQKRGLMDFLLHGVPYAFPGVPGSHVLGVPTAHAGPALSGTPRVRHAASRPAVVWPSSTGTKRGASLAPMCPGAPTFVDSNPRLYRWLTLVDALRIGSPGERHPVERILRREIHGS